MHGKDKLCRNSHGKYGSIKCTVCNGQRIHLWDCVGTQGSLNCCIGFVFTSSHHNAGEQIICNDVNGFICRLWETISTYVSRKGSYRFVLALKQIINI